jgi:hypothetical protein
VERADKRVALDTVTRFTNQGLVLQVHPSPAFKTKKMEEKKALERGLSSL